MGFRAAPFEADRCGTEGVIERGLADAAKLLGLAVLDVVRRHVADTRVTVHGVVPSDGLLGQLCVLAFGDQPAHHQAAEDVQVPVEVEARPLGQPLEFGDIPRPDLIG